MLGKVRPRNKSDKRYKNKSQLYSFLRLDLFIGLTLAVHRVFIIHEYGGEGLLFFFETGKDNFILLKKVITYVEKYVSTVITNIDQFSQFIIGKL